MKIKSCFKFGVLSSIILISACAHTTSHLRSGGCHSADCLYDRSNWSDVYREEVASGVSKFESYDEMVDRLKAKYYNE